MDAWNRWLLLACASLLAAAGCHSPYRADQGALLGGLTGAGVGALVGEAVDQPLAGAAIGAGVGALTGGVIGSNLDQIEAQNRAMIEARLGRPAPAGAVTVEDVIAMTQSGVDPDVIATHVHIHGVMTPLQAADLIYLQNNGVDKRVVQAMQSPRAGRSNVVQASGAQPVIVEEHIHYDPWGPPHLHYFHHHHGHRRWRARPNVSWGLSFHN
jgi:hypothetical protein